MPIEPPSFEDLYDLGKATALLRTEKLSEASFSPGYMFDILVGLDAAVGQEVSRYALELHRRTFIRTATGDDLDELAEDHYQLARRTGAAAVGKVTFSRPSTTAGPVFIEVGTRLATGDGIGFRTTDPAVLTGLSVTVDVAADAVGLRGNVEPARIVRIVEVLPDATVTVTNGERTAGGIDRETDEAFRGRIREYLRTLRRATRAALEFGAKIEGVVQATIADTSYPPTVYVADAGGGANQALLAQVAEELVNWRAAGVQVNVAAAAVVDQSVAMTLTFEAGIDTSAARDAVIASVVAAINSLRIGQTLFRSSIIAAARSVRGVTNVVVSNPAGDVAPSLNQLIRTREALITLG